MTEYLKNNDTAPLPEAKKCPVMHGKDLDELFAGIRLPVQQPAAQSESDNRPCKNNCPGCPRRLAP